MWWVFLLGLMVLVAKALSSFLAKIKLPLLGAPLCPEWCQSLSQMWFLYPVSIAMIVYGLTRNQMWAMVASFAVTIIIFLGGGTLGTVS